MLLRNKSPDIGYPENEGIWWQGTFGPEYEKRSVLRVCTLLLHLSLQILVHLINSNCHSSDLSGRSVLVVNTFGCCLVDDACCA